MAKTKVHGEYLDPSVISGQTQVTAVGADSVLIFDATDNALKKALLSDVIETVGSTPTFSQINATSDLTVDVGGSIILDADGTGIVDFKDGGTHIGRIENASSDFKLESRVQDKDIVLVGNDSGTGVEALRLDMSDAGTGIFNHDIKLGDNGQALFGAGDDLTIYHDGSDSYIKDTGTGNLLIQYSDLYFSKDAGSTHSVVFRSTGRVGIGTTGPDTGLHLSGGDNTAAKLTLTNTAPSPDNSWSLHPIYNGQDLILQEDGTARVTFTSATGEQTNSGSQPALFLQDTTAGGGAGNGGQIIFKGHHASSSDGFREFAKILGLKQNATGGDTHGELRFYVNKGAASPSEVGRFNHEGALTLKGGDTGGRQDLVFNNGSMSLANNASYTLSGVLNTGALISIGSNRSNVGVTYDHCIIFAETGTAATVVGNPSGRIAINSSSTDNKLNVYVSSGDLILVNYIQSTITVTIAAFVFQGN